MAEVLIMCSGVKYIEICSLRWNGGLSFQMMRAAGISIYAAELSGA